MICSEVVEWNGVSGMLSGGLSASGGARTVNAMLWQDSEWDLPPEQLIRDALWGRCSWNLSRRADGMSRVVVSSTESLVGAADIDKARLEGDLLLANGGSCERDSLMSLQGNGRRWPCRATAGGATG